jgi:hypothetical protein
MKKIVLSFIILASICSCSSSVKITSSWVSPNAAKKTFKHILVLALAPAKYSDAGIVAEQDIAAQLQKIGIQASSAQAEYGPQKFKNDDEEAAISQIKKSGEDGVIIISLLDVDKEKNYVPGSWTPPVYYGRFWGYYNYWYSRAYTPGYYETTQKYYFETNFYDVSNRGLLYNAHSHVIDPLSVKNLAAKFSKTMIADMKQKGLLG